MPPPDLPRYAPVSDIVHPVEIGILPSLRDQRDLPLLDRLDGRLGQRLHPHKPLLRDIGLYNGFAPVAMPDGMCIVFLLNKVAALSKVLQDRLATLKPV